MKALNVNLDLSGILLIFLIIVCIGEPDILDGLIKMANDCKE